MARQTKCRSALVPFLVALLFVVILPAAAPAGLSGNDGTSTVPAFTAPTVGTGDPAPTNSGDPDELGIYGRQAVRPSVVPGQISLDPPRVPVEPEPKTPVELIVQAFLLGLGSLFFGF